MSVAVLCFLGFDGISMLAEESHGLAERGSASRWSSRCPRRPLFIAQTWVAALLAGGRAAFSNDLVNNAFFTLVQQASGTGWQNAFFVVNVLAVGIANAMAAQAATAGCSTR